MDIGIGTFLSIFIAFSLFPGPKSVVVLITVDIDRTVIYFIARTQVSVNIFLGLNSACAHSYYMPIISLYAIVEIDMWQDLIKELNGYGMNDAAIAEHVGVYPSTIQRLRLGDAKMPRWDTGDAIINLAKRKRKGRRK